MFEIEVKNFDLDNNKTDIKNIEKRFGEVKIGGESIPLARTLLLATPSPRGSAPKTSESGNYTNSTMSCLPRACASL